MKKTALLALGLTMMLGTYTVAQDEKPAAETKPAAAAKPPAPPVENPCKNKVQVTDLTGIQQGGGQMYDYFLQLKNPTEKDVFLDVKFDTFPGSTHLYTPVQKDIKIKAKKSQTIRFGNGLKNNVSVASITVQVDKDKVGKKPTISLVNCREKK